MSVNRLHPYVIITALFLSSLSFYGQTDTVSINVELVKAEAAIDTNFYLAFSLANKTYQRSLEIGYNEGIVRSLKVMADSKDYMGDYSESQRHNFELMDYYERANDEAGIADMNVNIGIIHYYQGNYDKSVEVMRKALGYYTHEADSEGISTCYNNIANCFADDDGWDSSLVYYFKALDIDRAMGSDYGQSLLMGNIGETYIAMEEFDKAERYLDSALSFAFKSQDEWQQSNIYTAFGDLNIQRSDYKAANRYYEQAYRLLNAINAAAELEELYESMSELYELQGDTAKALHYLKLNLAISDSLYSVESARKIAEMEVMHDIDQIEDALREKEVEKELQAYLFVVVAVVVGLILIIIAVIFVFTLRNARNRKRNNEKLKQINAHVEEKNREITDSINYAKRLQQAILPPKEVFNNNLEDSFIMFKPKDVVSGDFYWMERVGDWILFAVADCTGHGVPGAMVSVVCSNALNSATREFNLIEPAEILEKTKEQVIETFERSGKNVRDGMDISLCAFNPETKVMKWAGANNPVWIISDSELPSADRAMRDNEGRVLNDFKASRQPVGKYETDEAFRQQEFQLRAGDMIYLLSDGYQDQFGGAGSKKYKAKQLKEFLLGVCQERMNRQRELLTAEFDRWKGDIEQVDDVCVIGVRV